MQEKGVTLAILIDGDNASPKIIVGLLAEIAKYGVAGVRRIYGDWTKPQLTGWKECLLEHSIQPIQQFAYTFARLAARIREQGVTVYGFGERKTPRPFVTACDKFVYFDVLQSESGASAPAAVLRPGFETPG